MMKRMLLPVMLVVAASCAHGSDVGIESLDYAKIKALLPSGWIIKSVTVVEAPAAWRKAKGGKGIMVSLENPTATVHDKMVGDYHPVYTFALVPLGWEGNSMLGQTFVDGKIRQAKKPSPSQIYPDRFRKSYSSFHYFESYIGHGSWKKPFEDLSEYFDVVKEASNK